MRLSFIFLPTTWNRTTAIIVSILEKKGRSNKSKNNIIICMKEAFCIALRDLGGKFSITAFFKYKKYSTPIS